MTQVIGLRSAYLGLRVCFALTAAGGLCGIAQAKQSVNKTFQNPVIWEDLADLDVIRVGDTYYYSASNMHYSPGAPILRSKDLVNWEYIGHSLPSLDFGPQYDMKGGTAYVGGSWASFLGYRKSNKAFYWGGCINFHHTHIYMAPEAAGPWKKSAELDQCYYDAGLLVDDDDTMYVAFGNTAMKVAQLSPDGTKEVKSQTIFQSPPEIGALEGSRFYKVNGNYYIFTTHPADGQYVLRSTTGPFGPYTARKIVLKEKSPVPGTGSPHQGALVQTKAGKWYYMAFTDAYPGGRIPVLAPVTWTKDGWPEVELVGDNKWGLSYPMPVPGAKQIAYKGFFDSFSTKELGPEWEWNHNPDNAKWSAGKGLILETANVTDDIHLARNTLTHRIVGPQSTATVILDYSQMKTGDLAGLAILRDWSALIGVSKEAEGAKLVMKDGMALDSKHWTADNKGAVKQSAVVEGGIIWLRATADTRPGPGHKVSFSYSTDGTNFQNFGEPFVLSADWPFFMAYRFAIFNYATQSLGGKVSVTSFSITKP